jgi:hypothetical protein
MSAKAKDKAQIDAERIVFTTTGLKFATNGDHDRLVQSIAEQFRKRDFDFTVYRNAWLRALGGKIFHKSHEIDALAMTTEWLRERSDKLERLEATQKHAAMIAEYGPLVTAGGQIVGSSRP